VVTDTRDSCAEFYWRPEPTDEFHVLVRLNNFGLHAPSYTLEKPTNTFRVLILGDSFPQGMQVTMEQTFPWLLQGQLGQVNGKQVEVINLSIDAFGTDRELLLYAILGWQFQPDLVLLSIYPGNDIQDNQIDLEARRYGYRINRAFFTLENDTLQLHNSIQLDSSLYPDSPAFQWLAGIQAAQTPAPPEHLPERPKVTATDPYTLEYPVELGLYLPEDTYWRDAWGLTEALLAQFRDVMKTSGVPFAAFIIPDRRAVHQDDWDATIAQYNDVLPDLRDADPSAPGMRLEQFLAAQDIPVLDVTSALRAWAEAHPDGRLYYPGDGHFTPDGHAVTVEALLAWLRSSGLVS
jgi:lysophospholipase L1-like esterase